MENIPEQKTPEKWYFKTGFLVIVFLMAGPLVLPLIWLRPSFSWTKKIILTVVIAVVSYFLIQVTIKSLQSIEEYYYLMNL